MADLVILGVVAIGAAAIGLAFGIVVLAPRILRAMDRAQQDKETRDGRD